MTFTLPAESGDTASITIDYNAGKVLVTLPGVAVDEAFCDWLKTEERAFVNTYPMEFSEIADRLNQEMHAKAKQVLEHVKYFLGHDQILDDVVSGIHDLAWSEDSCTFHSFPNLVHGKGGFKSEMALTERTRAWLQEGLDAGYKPFLAMRHLYRAMQEQSPRFKWIDATIAAELAVKECLARARPDLEALLIHLPSPPLSKLYGDVLESYTGTRSPYVKKLNEGSQKRNQLVHQPQAILVSEDEAIEYVRLVMKAIHHLYTLIYPDWEIARELNRFGRAGI